MSTTPASTLTAPSPANKKLDDGVRECRATQNISGRYINRNKLKAMLRMTFGVGAYDIYVSCASAFKPCKVRDAVLTVIIR